MTNEKVLRMTVDDLIVYGKAHCHSDHVKLLLGDLLNLNPLELLNHLNDQVEEEKVEKFKNEIKSLEENKPLQYVIGNINFYGNNYIINENVLIPRFETEELVDNTIKYIKEIFKSEKIRILDIGCGSGVIGLSLKKTFPNSEVDLIDISSKALEVAKLNAEKLNLEVNFIESDVFEKIKEKYDVIISNPPYIKENEEIEKIVKDNEPHIALYGGEDGLDIYRKIINNIKNHLNSKFLISFEIGMSQKNDIENLLKHNLENIKIISKKDLSERDRMIFAYKCE